MKKMLLFAMLLVSTSLFSQIPDSLEVTLPWDLIYVGDCNSSPGIAPTTTNEGVVISEAEVILEVEDDNGDCYKKLLEYTILDWLGNNAYTFTQVLRVDETLTLNGVSDVTITYDELPFSLTASDLVVDADQTHTYSFDPNDETATSINYGVSDATGGVYDLFVYNHTDNSVAEINIIITDCSEDVVIDIPNTSTIEFNGEYFIPFTAALLGVNVEYPCSDFELTIKSGNLNGVFAQNIGETIEVEVRAKINMGSQTLFTENIMVIISGVGPSPVPMYIEEKIFTAGEEITLDIWSDQLDGLLSFQLRLDFINAQILDITEGAPFDDIPHNIFNDGKTINSLWIPNDVMPIDVPSNETWFTLTVLPSIDGSTFDIFTTGNDPWSEIVIEDSLDISGTSADFNFEVAERNFLVSNEDVEDNILLVHNNPVSDRLVLSGFFQDMVVAELSIYNLEGRNVLSKEIAISGNRLDVDVAQLQNGIYFLKLNGLKSETIRFVKI